MPAKTVYHNTPENAQLIGWVHVPEYCFGNPKAPFVIHDHIRGSFVYSEDANA